MGTFTYSDVLVPGNISGVTNISDTPCRMELVVDPPGGNNVLQPQELAAAVEYSCVGIQPTSTIQWR